MEEENRFLSDAAVGGAKLPTLLAHLLYDLNTHKTASIVGMFVILVLSFSEKLKLILSISLTNTTLQYVRIND